MVMNDSEKGQQWFGVAFGGVGPNLMRFHSSAPPGKSVCQLYPQLPENKLQFYSKLYILVLYLPGKLLTVPNIPIMSSNWVVYPLSYMFFISYIYIPNILNLLQYQVGDIPHVLPSHRGYSQLCPQHHSHPPWPRGIPHFFADLTHLSPTVVSPIASSIHQWNNSSRNVNICGL